MWKWTSLLLTVAACGFPRPADVIACTPGEFSECRGDTEITCNSTGTDYDAVQCERGCDPAAGGCRLCQASQTVCVNGKVQSCDATGAVTSSEACPLGCFEDQPRCREIDPSNNLAMYLDLVANPPDLDMSKGGNINTSTGIISTASGIISVPNYLTSAPSNGSAIRVFVAKSVQLGNVAIQTNDLFQGPAFAIVAAKDITISGDVTISGGDLTTTACVGGRAMVSGVQDQTSMAYESGSGGGGHATNGGRGGDATGGADGPVIGGSKGLASGTITLVPLRGGCAGGGIVDNTILFTAYGARGGGAVQLSSRTVIHIDGTLDVKGQDGEDIQTTNGGATTGGGGGGGLLIEAPLVTLGPAAALLAKGGNGGSSCSPGTCDANYGAGGTGGTADSLAIDGTTAAVAAGGGGGGAGRIRINTKDGTYTKVNTSIEAGTLTTGALSTR